MSILIVAPMVQFILFPFTADYEIKVLDIAFIDNDNSTLSHNLINEFSASSHVRSKGMVDSESYADKLMKADKIDFLVEIPQNFEKNIIGREGTTIAITANAINTVKAGIGCGYVQTVIGDYLKETSENTGLAALSNNAQLFMTNIYWYNEQMN